MNKTISISLIVLLVWFVVYAMLGKDTIQWSMALHSIESCFFIILLTQLKKEIPVINWVVDTVIVYFCYRIVACLLFFLDLSVFDFLNTGTFPMFLISFAILLSLIFNRKKL